LLLGLLVALIAVCSCASPKPPDRDTDVAAYRAVTPPDAPPPDLSATPEEVREAFNLGKQHIAGGLGWLYFNAHLLDEDGDRWTAMFAILRDGQVFATLDSPDKRVHLPVYEKLDTAFDLANRKVIGGSVTTLRQPDAGKLFFVFEFRSREASLIFELSAVKPPIAVSGDGMITMGRTGQSRYYLIPNLRVTAQGQAAGHGIRATGVGWMDHQYGAWNILRNTRWHWHAIHLSTGHQIMIYEIDTAGERAEELCDIIDPAGRLQPNQSCTTRATQAWKSEKSGKKWSIGWEIEIPAYNAKLEIIPDAPDREVTPIIYEGACFVTGTFSGEPVTGRSFYEEHQK
jgi:hypothetical protein